MLFDYREKFSELEIEKFREAFTFFDRQGDGTMKTESVGLAMRSMGALVTAKEIKLLIAKYDPDRTGKIVADDYINMMSEVVDKPDDKDIIRSAFGAFDKQDNGLLDIEEMKHVFTRIGDTLSPEEVNNFTNVLDTHGDGFARMNDVLAILTPQTSRDMYSRQVLTN